VIRIDRGQRQSMRIMVASRCPLAVLPRHVQKLLDLGLFKHLRRQERPRRFDAADSVLQRPDSRSRPIPRPSPRGWRRNTGLGRGFGAHPAIPNPKDPTMRDFLHSLKMMLFDEGGAELIFSHVRNLLIASVIIAAGIYANRQAPDVEIFGVANEEIAGVAVAAIGFSLAGLNLIDGLLKLSKVGGSFALRIALVGLYLFFSMRLVHFVVLLRAG
jgi:hypothetical protein